MSGLALPFLEPAIAFSVVILGLLVALGARVGLAALIGVAAVAALFHGAAHGGELPAGVDRIGFSLGFVSSTVVMLAAGLAAGLGLARSAVPARWVRPLLGLSTATAGVSLFVT
jgi:urease accessory protein